MRQYVDSPTQEEAILDLVLGNKPRQVTDVSVGDHFGNSDHNSISFKTLVEKDRSSPRVKVLNWGKANYNSIRQELGNVDWGRLFEGKSTSDMWESFKSQLLTIQDKYVSVKMKYKDGKRDCELSVKFWKV